MSNNKTPNVEVDIESSTFKEKTIDFMGKLNADLENSKKTVEFHKLIVSTFKEHKIEHPFIADLEDSILESEKFIKSLEDRKIQAKKLEQFLDGEFVLSFDRFAFLMIDVLGSQMVNYVELKNEFAEVSKLWKTSDKKLN